MKDLAVHLHLYYTEQLPQILSYLRNLSGIKYDLYVTLTEDNPEIIEKLKRFNQNTTILKVDNCGYDIGPFIYFLHHINMAEYKYILKLHTKGEKSKNHTWLNGHRMDNALWGRILWQSLLGTQEQIRQNIDKLNENKDINMLGSKYCITNDSKNYEKLLPNINKELVKLNFKPVDSLSFVAGSMFLTRTECTKPLLNYKLSDFKPTDKNIKEGTLAHVLERIFGILGQPIHSIDHGNYTLSFFFVALKRFLYQKKQTSSGKIMIKICKIPVCAKK